MRGIPFVHNGLHRNQKVFERSGQPLAYRLLTATHRSGSVERHLDDGIDFHASGLIAAGCPPRRGINGGEAAIGADEIEVTKADEVQIRLKPMPRINVGNVREWLQNAQQAGYSASLFCQQYAISRRQMQRYTRVAFGQSPQQWLDQQRLINAAGLLKKHRSVKQVAFELGFKQLSHFSREFRSFYGLSPTGFLKWSDSEFNQMETVEYRDADVAKRYLNSSDRHG